MSFLRAWFAASPFRLGYLSYSAISKPKEGKHLFQFRLPQFISTALLTPRNCSANLTHSSHFASVLSPSRRVAESDSDDEDDYLSRRVREFEWHRRSLADLHLNPKKFRITPSFISRKNIKDLFFLHRVSSPNIVSHKRGRNKNIAKKVLPQKRDASKNTFGRFTRLTDWLLCIWTASRLFKRERDYLSHHENIFLAFNPGHITSDRLNSRERPKIIC